MTPHIHNPLRMLLRVSGLTAAIVVAGLFGAAGSAFAAQLPDGFVSVVGLSQTGIEVEAVIETGQAETQYEIQWAPLEKGERPNESSSLWKTISGGSGTVPALPEHAERTPTADLVGLAPETSYYLRVKVRNVVGEANGPALWYQTRPLHPQVDKAEASHASATSVHLEADVRPDAFPTSWRFEYASSRVELENEKYLVGQTGTISSGETEAFQRVKADLTGLNPETKYYVRFFAENGNGPGTLEAGVNNRDIQVPPKEESIHGSPNAIRAVETGGKPVVHTFASHGFDVEKEAIRVVGAVEPHGVDTHYHFEYVSQSQFEAGGWSEAQSTASVDVGAGEFVNGEFPTVLADADLYGLDPGAAYRYRLVATNISPGNPVVYREERTLTVPAAGGAEGAGEAAQAGCPNEALRSGPSAMLPDCRAFEQITPSEKSGAQDTFKYGATTEASLVSEDGNRFWLHVPGVEWGPSPDARIASYFFERSPQGWQMVSTRPAGYDGPDSFQPFLFSGDLSLTGLISEWETNFENSSGNIELESGPPGGPYTASPTVSIPRAEVEKENAWIAASADFSKLIFQSTDRRLLGKATGTASGEDLYEVSEGHIRLVNRAIGACGARMVSGHEGRQRAGLPTTASSPHAVSADGSRVFFEATPGGVCTEPAHLYVRENGLTTIDIGQYTFLAASPDGSEVLLEKAEGNSREAFLYDTVTHQVTHLLTTQAPRDANSGLRFMTVSSELKAFYFYSDEPLNSETPGLVDGQLHYLYRYDVAGRTLSFVAESLVDTSNSYNWESASPEGRFFYWISPSVAGFPDGDHSKQVFRFDSATGVVQCVSCASPYDPAPSLSTTLTEPGSTGPDDTGPADAVPGVRDASDDGRYVFFDTPSALVPQDTNGEAPPGNVDSENSSGAYSVSSDVYEWRGDGVDGCARMAGCVSLITPGVGGYKNELLGTTASGGDVFVATHASLVPGDRDTSGDVYDARVGGGFAPPAAGPVECEAGACQAPTSVPIDSTPGSLTFTGPGNPSATSPASGKSSGGSKIKTRKRLRRKQSHRKRKGRVKRGVGAGVRTRGMAKGGGR